MEEIFIKPDKNKKPFTWSKWRKLGLFKMTPFERLLMLRLHQIFTAKAWLFKTEIEWDIKDMQEFVKDFYKYAKDNKVI